MWVMGGEEVKEVYEGLIQLFYSFHGWDSSRRCGQVARGKMVLLGHCMTAGGDGFPPSREQGFGELGLG